MTKTEEQVLVKFRYALALKKLQAKNKKVKKRNIQKGIVDMELDQSYGDISSTTGLRPATISNLVTGISEIKGYTLFLILRSLKISFAEFGKVFDRLSEEDVLRYKKEIEDDRKKRKNKLT